MKQNNFEEFDLDIIYKKLTAPSKPMMVKANEFFRPEKSMLQRFQEQVETYYANTAPKVYPAFLNRQ